MTEQKKLTKEAIKANMLSNASSPRYSNVGHAWVVRGMLAILKYQTDEEQMAGVTVEDNGVGFNGVDAEILTSISIQATKYLTMRPNDTERYTRCISPKQMEIARKKMLKYAGQLARISNMSQ